MTMWKPVPGYPDYEVSDAGHFRVAATGKLKACTPMRMGYLTVKLSRDKRAKTLRAHSLVLEAFVGSRPAGLQTRHLNGVRSDNRLANLAWGTAEENHADKVNHQTDRSHYKGKHFKDHPNGKLSAGDVTVLKQLVKVFRQRDLAAIWGVHQSTVSNAVKERS